MKIEIEQIRSMLLAATDLKEQLTTCVYNQNESLANLIRNVGSSNLAYNSFVFANNVETQTTENIESLQVVIDFLNKQIENYVVVSTNAEEKIDSLIAEISEGISGISRGKID